MLTKKIHIIQHSFKIFLVKKNRSSSEYSSDYSRGDAEGSWSIDKVYVGYIIILVLFLVLR